MFSVLRVIRFTRKPLVITKNIFILSLREIKIQPCVNCFYCHCMANYFQWFGRRQSERWLRIKHSIDKMVVVPLEM